MKIFIFFLFLLSWISVGEAQTTSERQDPAKKPGPSKVAILPLAINSPENIEFMREGLLDMLSSRVFLEGRVEVLEKKAVKKAFSGVPGEIDEEKARNIGTQLEVDYVVFGSLTKLGDSASLDLKVVEIKGDKAPSSVFVQARKMEEIITGVDEIARKIDERILGYSLATPVLTKPEKPAPAETAALPPPPGFRPYGPARGPGISPAQEFWQSRPLAYKVRGIAVGDLDGDGRKEIVMIGPRELNIYRLEQGEIRLLKKHEGKRLDSYLAVDVGDIDKDGKAEIFVTNVQGDSLSTTPQRDRLHSFVATFRNGEFKIEEADVDWFLRVVDSGAKGEVLFGQKKGLKEPFENPIMELAWDGKKVKEIRKAALSKGFSVYGFAPFEADGQTFNAFIDADFRLKVADASGRIVWRSQATYGSDVSFRANPPFAGVGYDEGADFAAINVRMIARGNEVLIIRNISPIGQLFKRQKYFTGGEIQSLIWTGAMLAERWKSQEISGYVADFELQETGEKGGPELIVAVNLPRESVLSGEENSALLISRRQ